MALYHTLCCCSVKEGSVRKELLAEARVLRFSLKNSSNVRVLERSVSVTCGLYVLPKRSLLYIKSAFSFKTFKFFCGSFIEDFNICKCWPYKIESASWPRRITAGSINLMWFSTETVSSGGILNTLHSLQQTKKRPHNIWKIFVETFPLLHPGFFHGLYKIIQIFLTLLTLSGTDCIMTRFSSASFSGVKHSNCWLT